MRKMTIFVLALLIALPGAVFSSCGNVELLPFLKEKSTVNGKGDQSGDVRCIDI